MQHIDLGLKDIPKVDLHKFLEFKGHKLIEVEEDVVRIEGQARLIIGKHYYYNELTFKLGYHISFCVTVLGMSCQQAINELLGFYIFYQ